MRIRLTVLLLSLTLATFAANAQIKPPNEAVKTTAEKLTVKDYENLLEKLKGGDTTIDFAKLRLAYTETKDYAPYGGGEQRGAMGEAVKSKDYAKALQLAEEMMKTNYIDLTTQFIAIVANTELGKTKEAEFHKKVFQGLMNAILMNDGKTVKTAIISVGISEQYFIMSYVKFRYASKTLENHNGSMFDVHHGENIETKEAGKFYFNIDKVFGRF